MTQNVTTVDYKDFKVDSANIPTKDHLVLKLKPIPSRDAFQYIEKITDRFNKIYNFNESFIQQLQVRLNSDKIICEGEINAPEDKTIRDLINGVKKYYLQQTAIHQDVAMIWCDESADTPTYKFWGERANVIKAINVIKFKIDQQKNL